MHYPTIDCHKNKTHAIKNPSTTECGFPYSDFIDSFENPLKKISFKPVDTITCDNCLNQLEKNNLFNKG